VGISIFLCVMLHTHTHIYIYICAILLSQYGVNGFADGVHPTGGITKACFIHKKKYNNPAIYITENGITISLLIFVYLFYF
jgi:hypothetical protein